MSRKLAIHGSIIAVIMIAGDLTLNEGKASQAVLRDIKPQAMLLEGRRQAYHANSYVGRAVTGD